MFSYYLTCFQNPVTRRVQSEHKMLYVIQVCDLDDSFLESTMYGELNYLSWNFLNDICI